MELSQMIESSGVKGKILIVEDELDIRQLLKLNLQGCGYSTEEVGSGEEAILKIKTNFYDLIVLDWMLPGVSGVEVARIARQMPNGVVCGILMLTAKSEPEDIVLGLESGADDYLSKPFDDSILVARISALMRRSKRLSREKNSETNDTPAEEIVVGPLSLSMKTYEVKLDGQTMALTPSEFKLLSTMVFNRGRVLTRDRLIEEVQGEGVSVIGRTVDTHVFGLRKKLGVHGDMIKTIRGVGYRFVERD